MQTYDELLADDFQLVDTSEPEKVFSKQGKLRALPAPCTRVLAVHLLASMASINGNRHAVMVCYTANCRLDCVHS